MFMGQKGDLYAFSMFKEERERFEKLYGESGSMPAARYNLYVERHYDKRSVDQNSYSWVVYNRISDSTGQDPEAVKIEMQIMFLSKDKLETSEKLADNKIKLDHLLIGSRKDLIATFMDIQDFNFPWEYRDTSDLNTKEFNKFMEDIRRWASMFKGLNIEEPNERHKRN